MHAILACVCVCLSVCIANKNQKEKRKKKGGAALVATRSPCGEQLKFHAEKSHGVNK